MMTVKRVVAPAVVGTTLMTIFSYLVSSSKKRNFIEPEVLFKLIDRLPLRDRKIIMRSVSWIGHYGMGVSFAAIYDILWRKTRLRPSLANGIVIGGLSGAAGILIWDLIFKLHPNPPSLHIKRYYGHLLIAHVIFAVAAAKIYPSKEENRS